MTMRRIALTLAALSLLASGPALAQSSASFKLQEHVLNQGGHPDAGGQILTSLGFRMTLDSIGEGVIGTALSGASFTMDGGFLPAYPPPGEVTGLRFDDAITLGWNAEKSAGTYNLYRDLAAGGYGTCEQSGIGGTTTTDSDAPAAGQLFSYIVTVRNRLAEEGTKGFASDGSERLGAFCPKAVFQPV